MGGKYANHGTAENKTAERVQLFNGRDLKVSGPRCIIYQGDYFRQTSTGRKYLRTLHMK